MASEDAGRTPPPDLPDSLDQWLDERADELGLSRERMVSELLAAFRALGGEDREGELETLRDEFEGKLTDVRERVIQVKREADGKAPADHGHPELRAELDALRGEGGDVGTLRERVVENRERMDAGFENYEEVLEYLTDTTDDLAERLDVLVRALVAVRDQTRRLAARNATRAAVDELARAANREGVENARCGECGAGVTVALLTEPSCPHCEATFEGVEPKRYFFGSNTLLVGDPPALEGGTDGGDADDLLDGVDDG